MALVDTTAEAELLQRLSVGSYPSVLWFAGDDKLDDYPGDPARDELVQWVESLLRTDVAPITGSAAFSAATRAEVCVLGYFEPFEGDAHAAYLRREAGRGNHLGESRSWLACPGDPCVVWTACCSGQGHVRSQILQDCGP